MIVKFAKPGRSFKGVALYLLHDAEKAATSERVAWTHSVNCCHDHIESAVHEMVTTCLDADLLKAEAGVRAGSGTVEKPVKHISLNWHPSERPEREAMIRAAESFLKHMGWQEHQAVLIAHDEKAHRHVHLIVNAIHPETGLKLNDSFERRRAQEWALAYEREMGKVFCLERQKPIAEREASPPRPVWLLLEQGIQARMREETARLIEAPEEAREARLQADGLEFRALKELQKDQRIAFFEGGRTAYRVVRDAVYREVRAQFKPEWRDLYAARRVGVDNDTLAALKADLIARQKAELEARRDAACAALRGERDAAYRALLDQQKEVRALLLDRQERALGSGALLGRLAEAAETQAPMPPATGSEVEPGRRRPAIHPLSWTNRAGMVAQNRAAMRWLDRVADRARSAPPAPGQGNSVRSALDRIYDRRPTIAAEVGPARSDKGLEPGPD